MVTRSKTRAGSLLCSLKLVPSNNFIEDNADEDPDELLRPNNSSFCSSSSVELNLDRIKREQHSDPHIFSINERLRQNHSNTNIHLKDDIL